MIINLCGQWTANCSAEGQHCIIIIIIIIILDCVHLLLQVIVAVSCAT